MHIPPIPRHRSYELVQYRARATIPMLAREIAAATNRCNNCNNTIPGNGYITKLIAASSQHRGRDLVFWLQTLSPTKCNFWMRIDEQLPTKWPLHVQHFAALPPPPRHHGYKDLSNLTQTADRICDCKRQGFAGARTYKNTPVGWKNHQATVAHSNWMTGQDKTRQEVISL